MRGLAKIAGLVLVLVLVAAACSTNAESSGDGGAALLQSFEGDAADTTMAADEDFAAEEPAEAGGVNDRALVGEEGDGGGETVDDPDDPVAQIRQASRQIIFRAGLTVAVTDVAATEAEAVRRIEAEGGFLFGQETIGLPEPSSVLIFKIEPDGFQTALDALGELGEVRSQTVSADDVTDRIVDLESRISTAEVSVERLRELLADAPNVQAIAALESQLLDRETELESMRGQLRTLRDQVALATITLTLTEALSRPALDLAITTYPGHADAGDSCPGDGGISVDQGDDVTVCFELTNAGDMPLTSFEVRDTVLELEMDDLIVVFGDPEETLEPGQFLILAAEISPGRSLRTQTRATAAPINADGEELENRRVSSTSSVFIEAIDPGGLPGFGDGISASVDVVRQVGGIAVLSLGFIIPLLWVPLLAWLLIRWRRNRRPEQPEADHTAAATQA